MFGVKYSRHIWEPDVIDVPIRHKINCIRYDLSKPGKPNSTFYNHFHTSQVNVFSDVTKMIFLKLWVLFDCSEQPI